MQQNILESKPDAKLRVYVVWLDVLGGDSRSAWPSDVLRDARVTHFWDPEGAVSEWADGKGDLAGPVVYDAFLAYDGDARFDDTPRDAARPVIGVTDRLLAALEL